MDEFKVNSDKLCDKAYELTGYYTELLNGINNLTERLLQIDGCFSFSGTGAYKDKARNISDECMDALTNLKTHIDMLFDIADNYATAERRNTDESNALGGN